jgi:FMN reductase
VSEGRRRLVVVSAGSGTPSSTRLLADLLAAGTADALRARGLGCSTAVLEAREHAHDAVDRLLSGRTSPGLAAAAGELARADAVIAVTPIFSASYSGVFKLFFDVVDPAALRAKPVLLGATAGIARHSLAVDHALRPLFAYLRMLIVPTAVCAVADDWGPYRQELTDRVERAAEELGDLLAARRPVPGLVLDPTP